MVGNERKWIAALVCASLMGLAACARDNAGQGDTTVGTAGGDVATTPDTAAAAATPAVGAADAMRITGGDQEIVQVLATVDQSEVEAGQLARDKARNAQVKTFARTLVTEHSRAMRKLGEVAKAAGISLPPRGATGATGAPGTATGDTVAKTGTPGTATPVGSSPASGVVAHLQTMHSQAMDQLRSATGASFDSVFVNGQVEAHQQALDLLQQARGQATHARLQQHVGEAITEVQGHLDRVRGLQQNLAGGAGAGSDTGARKGTGSDTGRRG